MQDADPTDVEKSLVRRLRAGDPEVLTEVLRTKAEPIRGRLLWRFQPWLSQEDVDDVLADALFRLWRYRDRFDPDRSSLATWFYMLARASAIDLLRKAKRERALQEEFAAVVAGTGRTSHDDRAACRDDFAERILELASPLDRRILMAVAESAERENWASKLAAEVGVAAGTLRTRKLRLVRRLRKHFTNIDNVLSLSARNQAMATFESKPGRHDLEDVATHESGDPRTLLSEYSDELRDLGKQIGEIVAAQNRERPENLRTVHAHLWNQAIADGSMGDDDRHRFLAALWGWSQDAESAKERQWQQVRLAAMGLAGDESNEFANQFERTLVALSQEIRSLVPPELLQKPSVGLVIDCTETGFPIALEGGATLASFRELVDAATPPTLATEGLADYFIDLMRKGRLALPALATDPSRSTPDSLFLVWKLEAPKPDAADPPDRWNKLKVPEIPTPLELELWQKHPQVAERLDRAICLAALIDASSSMSESAKETIPRESLRDLINCLSDMTARPVNEVAEFVLNFVAYGRADDPGAVASAPIEPVLRRRAVSVLTAVLAKETA